MGMMDSIKGKMEDSDAMRDRYEQLKSMAQSGELDDKGRTEYEQLRARFEKHDQ